MVPASASASKLITLFQNSHAEQQQRDALHAAGLDQRQRLEELVERAEAAGEDRDGAGAQQEVDLARREIVEVEAELGRDVGVGRLLVRQDDVEADRGRADIVRRRDCRPPSRPGRRR